MSRVSAFSSPFLVGFDELERALERLAKGSPDGYPPYNVERLPDDGDGGGCLRITLAVAGFSEDELEVTVERNELVIRGQQAEQPARTYLYRGIAGRHFQRTFVLAEGIEVVGAVLEDGLLSIDLARPKGARDARRIAVNQRA